MSCPLPADLWTRLCAHLAAHPTCTVTIHQHEGRVVYLDLGTVKQRVKAEETQHQEPAGRDVSVFWRR